MSKKKDLKSYCGIIEPPPHGKTRGTEEHCITKKQVRYYGVVPVKKETLKKHSKKKYDLVDESLRYRALVDRRNLMIKEFRFLKVIVDNKDERPAKRKTAEKRMNELRRQGELSRKKMAKQIELVEKLTIEDTIARALARQELAKKEADKKKATTKAVKKVVKKKKPSKK